MFHKKGENIKVVLLLVILVYLFFLNNSMQGYHSHVFVNGIVITHSHYPGECPANTSDKNQKNDKEQIIIFHGLLLVSGENIELNNFNDFLHESATAVIIPDLINHYKVTKNTQKGRAPPIVI